MRKKTQSGGCRSYIVNKELAFWKNSRKKRAELSIGNIELAFQNDEKENVQQN
jgi:hypothetical protein